MQNITYLLPAQHGVDNSLLPPFLSLIWHEEPDSSPGWSGVPHSISTEAKLLLGDAVSKSWSLGTDNEITGFSDVTTWALPWTEVSSVLSSSSTKSDPSSSTEILTILQ